MLQVRKQKVGRKVDCSKGIGRVSLVPVLGNTFMAWSVLKIVIIPSDSKERLEVFFIEIAFWIFCRLVRKEIGDKAVSSRRHQSTNEASKEVRIVVQGIIVW